MTNEELVLAIRAGENVSMFTEQLYLQNRGLIRKAAKAFHGLEDCDDLMQEGFLGMMRAVDLWEPLRDISFATYSYYWIRQSMRRYIAKYSRPISIPDYQNALIHKYRKESGIFGRDPRPDEVMRLLELSPEQYENLIKDLKTVNVRSTSEPISSENGDEITLEDIIPDNSSSMDEVIETIQAEELANELWGQVSRLPKDEQEVIRGKYQREQSYDQCGEALGISPQLVKSLCEKALRSLRRREVTKILEPYLTDSAAYSMGINSGYAKFISSGASAQERAVMRLEYETGPIWKGKPV